MPDIKCSQGSIIVTDFYCDNAYETTRMLIKKLVCEGNCETNCAVRSGRLLPSTVRHEVIASTKNIVDALNIAGPNS